MLTKYGLTRIARIYTNTLVSVTSSLWTSFKINLSREVLLSRVSTALEVTLSLNLLGKDSAFQRNLFDLAF